MPRLNLNQRQGKGNHFPPPKACLTWEPKKRGQDISNRRDHRPARSAQLLSDQEKPTRFAKHRRSQLVPLGKVSNRNPRIGRVGQSSLLGSSPNASRRRRGNCRAPEGETCQSVHRRAAARFRKRPMSTGSRKTHCHHVRRTEFKPRDPAVITCVPGLSQTERHKGNRAQ